MNNNDKKTVWVYAVILFTSAFIVLLITAYSQIKVNKNIDEVRNKLGSTEREKSNFQMSLSSALAENKKLNEKIQALEKEIENFKISEEKLEKELKDFRNENSLKFENYEKLIKANICYYDGDIKSCALILTREINKNYLESDAMQLYQKLLDITIRKAAQEFYYDGYEYYKNKDYDKAIESLKNSLSLVDNEYYSDDCYYFIGYSYFRKGNLNSVKEAMNTLLEKYPDSTYKKDVEMFLKANFN
ncbi:tetratricopeptide repeat protein [Acetivibrio clariflavus]|uniref:tetratricopeptide repeat protein n=1 Tax=Acetivibrio clariflavus TaxID=288965 RepID=UPI0031F5CC91